LSTIVKQINLLLNIPSFIGHNLTQN